MPMLPGVFYLVSFVGKIDLWCICGVNTLGRTRYHIPLLQNHQKYEAPKF